MADDNSTGEKTEDPTPKRKEEAREEGQVAKSQELGSAFVLMGSFVVLYIMFNKIIHGLKFRMVELLTMDQIPELDAAKSFQVIMESFYHIAEIVAPVMIASAVIGGLINFIQVGPLFTIKTIQPKLSNINPVSGAKNIFSMKSLMELLKSLAKLTIIVFLCYQPLHSSWHEIVNLTERGLDPALLYLGNLIFKIAVRIAIFMVFVGIADFFYQLWDHKKNLKMSKYEVKQERKEQEGDPQLQQKRKEKQREVSMNRMMSEMQEADVVVTNPTHIAVALKYDLDEMEAPVVIAKGEGYIAKKIKERARELEIEIVENKPLARSLNKMAEIGEEIPVDLYQAVAEVLAFVFQNNNKYN